MGDPRDTSWLCFRVGSAEYAIRLADVAEVGRGRSRYLIPTLSLDVAGIINVRGEPIPALDGGVLLIGAATRADRHVLILERDGVRIGLTVDAVLRMERDLDRELVEAPWNSDEPPSEPRGTCYWERVTRAGKRIRLVDSRALLARAVAMMSDRATQEGEGACHTAF